MERSVQYAETVGLDVGEVNVPFYFDFVGEGFGKTFDGLYKGVIDFEHWHFVRVYILEGFIFRGICKKALPFLIFNAVDL